MNNKQAILKILDDLLSGMKSDMQEIEMWADLESYAAVMMYKLEDRITAIKQEIKD